MAAVRKSKRINPNLAGRSNSGRFTRTCGALVHDPLTEDPSTSLIDLRKRPKLSSKDYQILLEKKIVTNQTNFICESCFRKSNTDSYTETIDDKVEDMDDSDDSHSDLISQCIETGKMLNSCILSDIVDVEAVNSIEEISSFDPLIWLAHRPPELIQLISNICNIDVNVASNKKLVILAKIVELIYYCCNSRKVLPNHSLENLLCYSFTNSKSYLSFLGSRSPGGSYSYVTKWLKDQSKDPIKYPSGLVKSVFDNSQKVGKTYTITGTNIVPTSVITSHLWITLDKYSDLQEQLKYKPGEWMWEEIDQDTSSKLIEFLTKPSENFRTTRNNFVSLCIESVYKQHKTSPTDFIDSQIKANETASKQKRCKICNCEADASFLHVIFAETR